MKSIVVALSAVLLPLAASAAEQKVGEQTRAWLDLQRSNNAAYGAVRPMPGDVADKVYERYLNSFTHPIPEFYKRDRFVQGGGSSGGGGSQQ